MTTYFIATPDDNNDDTSLVQLRCDFRSFENNTKFDTFLNKLDEDINDGIYVNFGMSDFNGEKRGYAMECDWKYQLIDYLIEDVNAADIETYIGELGIRRAYRYADASDFVELNDDLRTYEGLKSFFFKIMDHIMDLSPNVYEVEEQDYKKQFEKD
jgi:hypothetical protein